MEIQRIQQVGGGITLAHSILVAPSIILPMDCSSITQDEATTLIIMRADLVKSTLVRLGTVLTAVLAQKKRLFVYRTRRPFKSRGRASTVGPERWR